MSHCLAWIKVRAGWMKNQTYPREKLEKAILSLATTTNQPTTQRNEYL